MCAQYLFAAQSRLLLRMGRPLDAAERGIRFITRMEQQLMDRARRQPVAQVPGFAEVSEGL